MKKWSWGINGLHRMCGISLIEEPWWSEPLGDVVSWVCDHTPHIPLPFLKLFKTTQDGHTYTLYDWCGGDLHSVFCFYIHMPLANWALNRGKCVHHIELGWEEGKRIFYEENPEMWDEEEGDYGIENA